MKYWVKHVELLTSAAVHLILESVVTVVGYVVYFAGLGSCDIDS